MVTTRPDQSTTDMETTAELPDSLAHDLTVVMDDVVFEYRYRFSSEIVVQ